MAEPVPEMAKAAPFVEKLVSKGYEVLYLTDAIDEATITNMQKFGDYQLTDVSKEGLEVCGRGGGCRRAARNSSRKGHAGKEKDHLCSPGPPAVLHPSFFVVRFKHECGPSSTGGDWAKGEALDPWVPPTFLMVTKLKPDCCSYFAQLLEADEGEKAKEEALSKEFADVVDFLKKSLAERVEKVTGKDIIYMAYMYGVGLPQRMLWMQVGGEQCLNATACVPQTCHPAIFCSVLS
eukprot:1155037-Pelagomonas_calceolata.AAC.2